MTDNIQKLYEIAGVPRIYSEFNNGRETIVENVFSPYRQLELIKWLVKRGLLQISYSSFGNFQFCNFTHGGDYKAELNEALANFILQLWDELSSEQREEVKGILK